MCRNFSAMHQQIVGYPPLKIDFKSFLFFSAELFVTFGRILEVRFSIFNLKITWWYTKSVDRTNYGSLVPFACLIGYSLVY
jgi:hypothetical protein